MVSLLPMPQYNPGNALDFRGLNTGIDSIREQNHLNRQNALAERKVGLAENADRRAGEMHTLQMGQAQRQKDMEEARMIAGRVQYIQGLAPEQRMAAWRAARQQPAFRDLPAEFDNFDHAAPLLLGKAAEYLSPMDKAKMGNLQAQSGLYGAQARAAGQKSEMEGAIADMIRGNMGGGGGQPPAAAPPGPQGGSMQPQSFGGTGPQGGVMPAGGTPQAAQGASGAMPPQGDPNLILAQAAGGQPQPQQPAAPDLGPGQDMVDTPMGRMTRQRAQQMGMALALGGKGDAGKMMGDAAGQGMPGKEARNEIEKKLFAATEQKARLAGIRAKFKPEWQTIDEQLRQYGISWVDSIGPLRNRIPPEMRARHAEYAQYRQEAYQNINLYIKEITGAQMSEAEANRLRKAVPDPDRDGPTAFQSKLENTSVQTDLATARYNYLLRRGFQGNPWESGVSLERMQGIINDRGRQIEGMIRSSNPNAPDQAVQREAFRLVKQEFGI